MRKYIKRKNNIVNEKKKDELLNKYCNKKFLRFISDIIIS